MIRYMERFSLNGKVSIVTGGGRGIGEAYAEGLADAGSKVAILEMNLPRAQETAARMRADGRNVIAVECNVLEEESVKEAVDQVLKAYGDIDVLVNNVGDGLMMHTEDMTFDQWKHLISLNLDGAYNLTQIVGQRVMIPKRKGVIINTSSMSGIVANNPYPMGNCGYNTAKAGVIMFTKTMAEEWAKYNIRVNTIAPGFMKTEQTRPVMEENADLAARWLSYTPMGRIGTPDELACALIYLASDASTFTTGSVLVVDGGYTCR